MTRFRSKVDALVLVPALVALGLPVLLVLRGLAEGRPLAGAIVPIVLLAAIAPLFLISYQITRDELIVRQGWLRWRMRLDRIQVLKATRAMWSSPALSLDPGARVRRHAQPDHGPGRETWAGTGRRPGCNRRGQGAVRDRFARLGARANGNLVSARRCPGVGGVGNDGVSLKTE